MYQVRLPYYIVYRSILTNMFNHETSHSIIPPQEILYTLDPIEYKPKTENQ